MQHQFPSLTLTTFILISPLTPIYLNFLFSVFILLLCFFFYYSTKDVRKSLCI
ncbi:hypothetical protein BMQ_pBM40026 (plasmid) [Priestia megaterium QM B1551]|uniref:Uncharacterized protein n=1 Tax=Priestia megaterium (strain ATCC 12872 / QMB1551) TaxID=545693 RepID=D5E3D9_PRIM1|nr:hypothetical protein BMQ_pBM40026 [Priestia megaterium QM B1551]